MITTELFTPSSEFTFGEDDDIKTKICIDQHLRDVENALLELANNGNIVTDKIQPIIDMDLKVFSEKYNTGNLLDLPENDSLMRYLVNKPRSNARFILNPSDLLPDDILYFKEAEIFFKELTYLGVYKYWNKYSEVYGVAVIYLCSRNGNMYEIYGKFDDYNNLYYLKTSIVTYDILCDMLDYDEFSLEIDLRHVRRQYIITNINLLIND
ncbi:hypothetical protein I5M27_02420 [Adhaeribacter sp. BT258]|uniref:Uncharacterized protein n=1 Tax=Adhaeribacter terrigena TaxID=2793070 RepID=A0ABS1BXM5_9BACT|nr:hypothetical protein [Adhaeribacter terrigena]MBK0401820.1 hypothetical protein [Adhaeribacter terrigena]